jgi:transposase
MRFVPVKTAEQQAALMLVGVRDRLIRNRTQLSNAIRGYAGEFGLTAAKGKAHLDPLLERIQADESLPALARELFAAQAEEYAQLQAQIDQVDARLIAWHRADECSRRLIKIPGVGADGVIDRSTTRDIPHFPVARCEVAVLFGTLVTETILASVHVRAHQQAGHMDASDLIKLLQNTLRGGGRPHMEKWRNHVRPRTSEQTRPPAHHGRAWLERLQWVETRHSRFAQGCDAQA